MRRAPYHKGWSLRGRRTGAVERYKTMVSNGGCARMVAGVDGGVLIVQDLRGVLY